MSSHLDPDTLAAYVDGRLAVAELALANRHIDSCGSCRSELSALAALHADRPGAPGAADVGGRRESSGARLAVRASIGRYQLVHDRGRDSTGIVLRGYDPELARPVAIQRLVDADDARARDEARTLAGLGDPSIVGIYDVIGDEEGTCLVVELVEGTPLRDYCRGRSQREILDACLRAGRGLAAAHDAGVVHRDFKPENVLVEEGGAVRVSGFGLGRRDPATARADQYSFCIAVHELLTGVRPGSGRAPGSVTLSASLPRWIARTLRRGLARDPAARFSSMHPLLAALADDAHERRRRRLVLAAVAAGALVVGALAIIVAS